MQSLQCFCPKLALFKEHSAVLPLLYVYVYHSLFDTIPPMPIQCVLINTEEEITQAFPEQRASQLSGKSIST